MTGAEWTGAAVTTAANPPAAPPPPPPGGGRAGPSSRPLAPPLVAALNMIVCICYVEEVIQFLQTTIVTKKIVVDPCSH